MTIASTAFIGAVGGVGGIATLALELPAATVIMLRAISQAAVGFGFDLTKPEEKLDCLAVFSYGGPEGKNDPSESAYYLSRVGLAKLIQSSAGFLAAHSLTEVLGSVNSRTAPALLQFLIRIASRYEMVISKKILAQLVPGIGSAAGASLNAAFASHFHRVAKFHFGLKRLEAMHGEQVVQGVYYEALAQEKTPALKK